MDDHDEEKRTEKNLIVRSGKSEAAVTNNRRCARPIVLLKLTTDRHDASRGLSAIAELLVLSVIKSDKDALECIALLLF